MSVSLYGFMVIFNKKITNSWPYKKYVSYAYMLHVWFVAFVTACIYESSNEQNK